jgi:hypothetical protein
MQMWHNLTEMKDIHKYRKQERTVWCSGWHAEAYLVATSRKVTGSIPDEAIGFLKFT